MKYLPFYTCLILLLLLNYTPNFAQGDHKLIEISGSASCSTYKIVDEEHNDVYMPAAVVAALDCPSLVDFTDYALIYMDGLDVMLYKVGAYEEIKLFTMHEGMDGISNPVWSEDRTKVMFVIINQQRKHNYTDFARIISLDLSPDKKKVTSKVKFDRPVNFVCGGLCNSEPYEDFMYEGNAIVFKRNINIDDRAGEYERIILEENSVEEENKPASEISKIAHTLVKKGKGYGIINSEGKEMIPIQKNSVSPLGNGWFLVYDLPKRSVVDMNGKLVRNLPPHEHVTAFRDGFALYKDKDNKMYIIDESFRKIKQIPDKGHGVSTASAFKENGLAGVLAYKGGGSPRTSSGVINRNGELIIPYDFEHINTPKHGFRTAKKSGKAGVIDLEGNTVLPFEYNMISIVGKGLFRVKKQIAEFDKKFPTRDAYTIVWLNEKGEPFIDSDAFDSVKKVYDTPYFKTLKDKKYGILDEYGNELIPPKFKSMAFFNTEELLIWVKDENDKWMHVDANTFEPKEFVIKEFSNREPKMVTKSGDYYLIQFWKEINGANTFSFQNGQLKPVGSYSYLGPIFCELALVYNKNKKYILHKDGQLFDVSQYDRVQNFRFIR